MKEKLFYYYKNCWLKFQERNEQANILPCVNNSAVTCELENTFHIFINYKHCRAHTSNTDAKL